jgi:hypothetical protein
MSLKTFVYSRIVVAGLQLVESGKNVYFLSGLITRS